MKTLIFIRHAQAVDKSTTIIDHDRPLTTKGIKQSKAIRKLLKKLDYKPDYLLSSTAVRCTQTAEHFADKREIKLHTSQNLYFKGIKPYLTEIQMITDNYECAVLVGHNEDLTTVIAHYLAGSFPPVSKGSATIIEFDTDSWEKLESSKGKLVYYLSA